MEYKQLLKKYMTYIKNEESVTYIYPDISYFNSKGILMEKIYKFFTEEEYQELQKISQEVYKNG
jgi:hypothetical protein